MHCAIIGEKHNPSERERNQKMLTDCKTAEVEEKEEKKKRKKTMKQIFVVPKKKKSSY